MLRVKPEFIKSLSIFCCVSLRFGFCVDCAKVKSKDGLPSSGKLVILCTNISLPAASFSTLTTTT